MKQVTEIIIGNETIAIIDGVVLDSQLCHQLNHIVNYPKTEALLNRIKQCTGVSGNLYFFKSKNSDCIVAVCGWSGEPEFNMFLHIANLFEI